MNAPLTTLTDRDLMLNLWLTVQVLAEGEGLEMNACEQTVLREGKYPDPTMGVITLAGLMAEVEARLNLTGGLDGFKQGRAN